MVYASTLHSPVHDAGAKVWESIDPTARAAPPESWNDAEVKAMKGVIGIVKLPTGLSVVAERYEQAKAGRDALKVKWAKAKADGFNSAQALEGYVKIHDDPNAQATTLEKKGDVAAAFAGAAKTYKAAFRSDYGYHAQMEPLNAVVRINDGGRQGRGLGRQPGAGQVAQGGGEGARLQGRAGGLPPVLHGRRLRPALDRRLRGRMRADRQGREAPGQADLDARGGHRPGHVPAAIVPVPGGGDRRLRQR